MYLRKLLLVDALFKGSVDDTDKRESYLLPSQTTCENTLQPSLHQSSINAKGPEEIHLKLERGGKIKTMAFVSSNIWNILNPINNPRTASTANSPLVPISPKPKGGTRYTNLLGEEAETDRERRLQKALRRSEALVEYQCSRMIQMQASTVLTQLENQEKKKGKGKDKNKKDLAHWKAEEDARAARNEAWRKAVADFKAGKESAKERNERWNGGKQPVRRPLEKDIPKPKVPRKTVGNTEQDAGDGDGDEDEWEDEDDEI
ncbi:hypothetical protein FIBSPDRAFT_934662 [Athelia psychrophila]|uniref:Uncharacterized protein n=1 Tax=Athelia psychrophila TaxID=1759441 RepID=A0A166F1I9_9AGAM|nr:hypothetical protein FIBSPDRAFT_934662 [Fibularhizoctonia sp. CBS 109695]